MAGLRVQGAITDPQGNALYPASVSVSIGPQFVVNLTDIQDYYVWAGPVNANEPIVTGTLIASCPGYANNSKTVSLLISFDHSYLVNVVDFALTPLGALTGIVFDASTDNGLWRRKGFGRNAH
jgi:hypothetical protein